MRNEKITPLYERLSRDDELQGESCPVSPFPGSAWQTRLPPNS